MSELEFEEGTYNAAFKYGPYLEVDELGLNGVNVLLAISLQESSRRI